ncbi:MAG: extracellular solute-binding protein [Comamonadaceae bacterium]|jgi:putrescine transport system substrate-binding protein|uniref:Putrescine-binding periplasmic protein n=1 Tax=Hydrogenophaga borbori TaxID=2294117 RepID=A0A372EJ93_9BURK|nr:MULTISPECIES: extracellular solute-binding protein [Hydrogenophaga]NCT98229.1 extracellular solute-binding protein [Comamonadaceae bacterium]RFP78734.1 extracellular solute-binding protein [Hydrogenophaga borbori]WQB83840.1 extracellular solute-binding protein [Hydrogenophaga sp. SNF1]
MKKHVLVLAMAAVMVAACGKKEEPAPAPAPAPVATAPAPAPAPAGPVLDDEKVLNVYNWPDYITESMLADFEKEYGVKVNYDTFENNEALHAKLVAGNSGYDIVIPTAGFAKKQIDGGLYQPIDKSRLTNYGNLDPDFMKKIAGVDPDNKYLVPWAWGFTTVGINKQKVEKALGGMAMPENAWDLVFKPEYANKLKSCGIAYLDSPSEILPVALHYVGKPAYSENPEDFKVALDMLKKVRGSVRLFSSTMIDDIASGKACAFIGWSGDINIAAGRVKETGGKDEIVPLLPTGGGLVFIDTMAIPKDAKHVNNAHVFIDFYLRAANAAAMANEMNYPTGNKAALADIKDEVKGNKTIFLGPEDTARLIPTGGFSNDISSVLNDTYNAFKRGK